MSIKLNVVSERKGSNPGGVCEVLGSKGKILDGYFKYCVGSQLPKPSPFIPGNQPIYEVMASVLANKFGIRTPKNFVLSGKGVTFQGVDADKHAGRDLYFLSTLQPNPQGELVESRLGSLVNLDSIYLEALLIGDYNRRQNQVYFDGRASYVDVGCLRFACANEGMLKDEARGFDLRSHKDFKKNLFQVDRMNVRVAGNGQTINVREFIDNVPETEIPFFHEYAGSIPRALNTLLFPNEIEAIQGYLFQGFAHARKKFREAHLMV